MYKRFTLRFILAMVFLLSAGTAMFADNTVISTDSDPQVGTQAKGTFMKAILLDSLTNEPIEFATMSGK